MAIWVLEYQGEDWGARNWLSTEFRYSSPNRSLSFPLFATMGPEATSWLLFLAVLVNQSGRVMIPSIKTSVLADPAFGPAFSSSVGPLLSLVSLVCLGGKLLGAAFTDALGGWTVLVGVFGMWIVATLGAVLTSSVDLFGHFWLLNSFAYTVTWGAAVQVVGASYGEAERPAQLSKVASASRFGATLGNIFFGQLLSAGMHWRSVLMPVVPLQAVLLLLCIYKWSIDSPKPAKSTAASSSKDAPKQEDAPAPSILSAMLSLDVWLMLVPKALLFTYTQFFMNYIPQLLNVSYGFDHGQAATLGGVAQGGSVVGLLVVGNMVYKSLSQGGKVRLVGLLLVVCTLVPFALSLGPSVLPRLMVVPLTVLWGLAYALPFYIPPGEFAMQVHASLSSAANPHAPCVQAQTPLTGVQVVMAASAASQDSVEKPPPATVLTITPTRSRGRSAANRRRASSQTSSMRPALVSLRSGIHGRAPSPRMATSVLSFSRRRFLVPSRWSECHSACTGWVPRWRPRRRGIKAPQGMTEPGSWQQSSAY